MANETRKQDIGAPKDRAGVPSVESSVVSREQRVASMRERAVAAAGDLVSHGWKEADRIAASFESPVDDEARKGLARIEAQIRDERAALEAAIDRESISPDGVAVARNLEEIVAQSDAMPREELVDRMDGICDYLLANETDGFAILRGQTSIFSRKDGHAVPVSAELLDAMTSRNDYHADPEAKRNIRAFIRRYAETLAPDDPQFSDVRAIVDRIAARERVAAEKTQASEALRLFAAGDTFGAIDLVERIGAEMPSVEPQIKRAIREHLLDLFGSKEFSTMLQTASHDQRKRAYQVFARFFRPANVILRYPDAIEIVGKRELYELVARESAMEALASFPDVTDVISRETLYGLATDQDRALELFEKYPDALSVLGKERFYRAVFETRPHEIVERFPEAIPLLGEKVVFERALERDSFWTVEQFPAAWKVLSKETVFRRMLAENPGKAVRRFPGIFDELPKDEIYGALLARDARSIESYPDIPDVLGIGVVLRSLLESRFPTDEFLGVLSSLVRTQGSDAIFGSEEMRSAAPSLLIRARETFRFADRLVPWARSLEKLHEVYPSMADDHGSPWEQSVDLLVKTAREGNLLSLDRAEDGALFVDFIRKFGPGNERACLEAFVALKRARTMNELSDRVRGNLAELLGDAQVESFRSPDATLNAILQWKRDLTGILLRDKVPPGIRSEIGEGIFRGTKGSSPYGGQNDESEVVRMWERTVGKNPEAGRLPAGYEEIGFSVRGSTREKSVDFDRLEQEILDNPNVLGTIRRPYLESFSAGTRTRSYIVDVGRREVVRETHEQIQRMEEAVSRLSGRALDGAQKNLFRLRDRLEVFLRLPEGNAFADAAGDTEASVVRLMEELSAVREKSPAIDAYLRALSFSHILDRAPAAVAMALQELAGRGEAGDAVDGPMIHAVRKFLVGYLAEHYLNDNPVDHETGHEPFSPDLRKALARAWQVTGDLGNHPIIQASDRLRQAEAGRSTTRTVDVALVPAQGLLRTFAGDVGQVCYSSKHELLAKGGVPDLHAMIFVTGRGTSQEKLAGSVLFVETETPDGKKALIIRANNPLEDLFKKVDGADLVRATIDAAIETAKRRGLDLVVAPLDEGSGTHRLGVLDYYREQYSERPPVELVNEPETSFNGYDNWNSDGYHPVVEIWNRETA